MWKYIQSDELMHYGILGMKCGVRKTTNADIKPLYRIVDKKGENVLLEQNPTPKTAEFIGRLIPKIKKNQENYFDFTIKDRQGNRIGNASLNRNSKEEMNIVWIGIKSKYEGRGHGQSVMRTIIDDVRKNPDIKKITLEVPTTSQNARHIYDKLGFKTVSEKLLGDKDDVWGGLTEMELRVK